MFTSDQYQLLDFGDGRRLERFGAWVLDRPCPAAEQCARARPEIWSGAHARFDRTATESGEWTLASETLDARWAVRHGSILFELKRTHFGHLGLFPEQAANWDAINQRVTAAPQSPRVLNLFAYTGGSTLAAAAAGASLTHVDAARNVVAWARRNAELSGLADAPIRWIAEDALKFVKRAVKRGDQFDAIILDPPSYGHGPRGEVWRLSTHLPRLLALCADLLPPKTPEPARDTAHFVLLTAHTPGFGQRQLAALLRDNLPPGYVETHAMCLTTATGRWLDSGVAAWWLPSQG